MTRVQVLDVGDEVETEGGSQGVIVGIQPRADGLMYHSVAFADFTRHGWGRHQLTRHGGDLQVGDFVRVLGKCETLKTPDKDELDEEIGVIVDAIAEGFKGDFVVFVPCRQDAYECHTDQLARITRAEALQ